MPKPLAVLDRCDISPVRNMKNHETPRRTRSKTLRGDQGIDVHTSSCSTPNLHQQPPRVFDQSLNSPSSSYPLSQDNCPDVVWDYTSPKLPRGAKKREIKLTVQELLQNLNQCQTRKCSTQSAYIKLLEDFMAKQTVDVGVKKIEKTKKQNKKQSRNAIEELKKFLETIPRQSKELPAESKSKHSSTPASQRTAGTSNKPKHNISIKSFVDDDSTDEELWGDIDNSFIVKATQELEFINPASTIGSNQILEIVSTIPETAPISPKLVLEKKGTLFLEKTPSSDDVENFNDFLEELTNVNWDSDVDNDEWDNGFLIDEDDLSRIPDELLMGTSPANGAGTLASSALNGSYESKNPNGDINGKLGTKLNAIDNLQQEGVMRCSLIEAESLKDVAQLNTELYNSFEDQSFEDESLLCQPDVLSKIDEVENMLTQQIKCTPDEIEKKKDEAIKRRLRNRGKKTPK